MHIAAWASKVLDLQPHGFLWQGPHPKRDVHLPADRNAWAAGWSAACGHLESRYCGGKTAATCGECERGPSMRRCFFFFVGQMANPIWRYLEMLCLNVGKSWEIWFLGERPEAQPLGHWAIGPLGHWAMSMGSRQLTRVQVRGVRWFSVMGHVLFVWADLCHIFKDCMIWMIIITGPICLANLEVK